MTYSLRMKKLLKWAQENEKKLSQLSDQEFGRALQKFGFDFERSEDVSGVKYIIFSRNNISYRWQIDDDMGGMWTPTNILSSESYYFNNVKEPKSKDINNLIKAINNMIVAQKIENNSKMNPPANTKSLTRQTSNQSSAPAQTQTTKQTPSIQTTQTTQTTRTTRTTPRPRLVPPIIKLIEFYQGLDQFAKLPIQQKLAQATALENQVETITDRYTDFFEDLQEEYDNLPINSTITGSPAFKTNIGLAINNLKFIQNKFEDGVDYTENIKSIIDETRVEEYWETFSTNIGRALTVLEAMKNSLSPKATPAPAATAPAVAPAENQKKPMTEKDVDVWINTNRATYKAITEKYWKRIKNYKLNNPEKMTDQQWKEYFEKTNKHFQDKQSK